MLYRLLSLFIVMVILASADASFFPVILGPNIHASALLCAIIIWSARMNYQRVWLRSAAAGFFSDIFAWSLIGPQIFFFSLISALAGSLSKRFLSPHRAGEFFSISIFVVLGTILENLLSGAYTRVGALISANPLPSLSLANFGYIGLEILANLVILLVIFWPISKLDTPKGKDLKLMV